MSTYSVITLDSELNVPEWMPVSLFICKSLVGMETFTNTPLSKNKISIQRFFNKKVWFQVLGFGFATYSCVKLVSGSNSFPGSAINEL